jgi:DNA-binding MarR family transcriptional regulator
LPWLLRRVNQRYRAAIRDRLAECGFPEVPQPGYWAIMLLAGGGTDAGDLMRDMVVSKQAVSKVVEALVGAGFVVREPHESDRRRTDLSLTANGRKAARVIGDAQRLTEETFIAELGAARFADLIRTLAQLARRDD